MIRAARTADRSLETRIAGDHVVGEHAAIAPASDTKMLCIGKTLRDEIIRASQNIFDVFMAPVLIDGLTVFSLSTRTSTIVDSKNQVSVPSEELPFKLK